MLDGGDVRLRAVLSAVNDGVVLVDPVGTVLMCNPACERLFGYRSEELVGRDIATLMPRRRS